MISVESLEDFPAMHLVRTNRLVRTVGKLTLLMLLFSIIGLVFIPWRQTAKGIGTVVALNPQERPQPVRSPSKGVISEVKEGLREGSFVEAGATSRSPDAVCCRRCFTTGHTNHCHGGERGFGDVCAGSRQAGCRIAN